ncbi:MAG TPA: RsmG family class I SAM-dependent methyltransferase [Polyangiaceae bacterium]
MALAQLGEGWRALLGREIEAFGVAERAGETFLVRAATYLDRLVHWNQRIDLTAAREPEELVDLAFADALALSGHGVLRAAERWVDVGSGMGAPGVALAVCEPLLSVTLVEPRAKRVAFLRTLAASLDGLSLEIRRERSEALADASFEVAISRATLAPPLWLREGARLATREVWVLLAREAAPELPGWEAAVDLRFEWPLTSRARRAVCFRRTQNETGTVETVAESQVTTLQPK